jgi:transposase-like protein
MTKAEQVRLTVWRLRVLRQAADVGNVARVCRSFGISRKSFYKWKRRHAEHGDAGLCDRPRTPLLSPRATAREIVSKILTCASTITSAQAGSRHTCTGSTGSRSRSPRCIAS